MLFKTKLLISLTSIGIASATGAGVYYFKDKSNKKNLTKKSTTTTIT